MPTINLGLRYISDEEMEYIQHAIKYLEVSAFLKDNFYRNINFIIHMLVQNKDTIDRMLPADHLIAYLWLLKEVAEALKE